jgi:predicted metal-binding protein
MEIGEHLQALCANASVYGASKVAPVPVQNITVDPRVNFKCQVPLCKYYGRSHICPPLVMSAEEFSKVLARYRYGILVQISVPATELGEDRDKAVHDQVKKLNEIWPSWNEMPS